MPEVKLSVVAEVCGIPFHKGGFNAFFKLPKLAKQGYLVDDWGELLFFETKEAAEEAAINFLVREFSNAPT